MKDIRWQQRFDNYLKALQTLTNAVDLANERPLSELEQQGIIQSFEFTHELAWKVLKDYLGHQGITGLIGSRDATRAAFKNELIEAGDDWMRMIEARNETSHTYNLETARAIVADIHERFYPAFEQLAARLSSLRDQPEDGV